jgi:nucleoside-diphosphate-sugar epimerase
VGERVLVTGICGCLGAWTARALLDAGHDVTGYDLGGERHRLELVLGADAQAIEVLEGDVTDLDALGRALDERDATRLVHLAALQVPACREDPALGARVNVVGTVNAFRAVAERLARIPGVVYASSAAVYGRQDPSPAPEAGGAGPGTHYGVFKVANEAAARIFWQDEHVPSIGLRPYVVYGPGRDQGLTSDPTHAMAAAARGEGYTIGFGGTAQYDYAPDVGLTVARAALAVERGAVVGNFPGVAASAAEVAAAIEAAAPGVAIEWADTPLPFPAELEARLLDEALGGVPRTPLRDGVAATVERFRSAAATR